MTRVPPCQQATDRRDAHCARIHSGHWAVGRDRAAIRNVSVDARTGQRPEHHIEGGRQRATVPSVRSLHASREYYLGSRLRFAPEGGDGARMILKIAVKNNDPVTRNVAKSRFNRRVLTKIARKLYATNTAVRRGNIRNHRPGVFGALVIDKDHLVVGTELAAYFGDFLYQHMQAVPAAIYWRDKRNEGHARFNRQSDGFFCKSLARASGVPSVACTQE